MHVCCAIVVRIQFPSIFSMEFAADIPMRASMWITVWFDSMSVYLPNEPNITSHVSGVSVNALCFICLFVIVLNVFHVNT